MPPFKRIPKKKVGDFKEDLILRSYEILINKGIYPEGKVVLGSFSTYSRYCGPRETVFTMLCRKNMGCSHFIIGRDNTGFADYYPVDASQRLVEKLGDIGIEAIMFPPIAFDRADGRYKDEQRCNEPLKISDSEAHGRLLKHEKLPDWFMSSDVQESLIRHAQLEGEFVQN